jgi:hypothetical protein
MALTNLKQLKTNIMKLRTLLTTVMLLVLTLSLTQCKKAIEDIVDPPSGGGGGGTLSGNPGNPRFNLQFSNGNNVDLDLHVRTPNNSEIYFGNTSAQNGSLDVDCICGSCGSTGNENIFWTDGSAPSGTYKAWVYYYGDCGSSGATSTYTLRVMQNNTVVATYTGTLSATNRTSAVYTFVK